MQVRTFYFPQKNIEWRIARDVQFGIWFWVKCNIDIFAGMYELSYILERAFAYIVNTGRVFEDELLQKEK